MAMGVLLEQKKKLGTGKTREGNERRIWSKILIHSMKFHYEVITLYNEYVQRRHFKD